MESIQYVLVELQKNLCEPDHCRKAVSSCLNFRSIVIYMLFVFYYRFHKDNTCNVLTIVVHVGEHCLQAFSKVNKKVKGNQVTDQQHNLRPVNVVTISDF